MPLVKVGIITSAHGIRGQVKLRSLTHSPETLLQCGTLTDQTGKRSFRLTKHGVKGDALIVSIEGVSDRNAAEALKNTLLFAQPDKLPEDEARYHALIDMEARTQDGKFYGHVKAVYNFGAGDIIEFALSANRSEMLPYNENFIGEMDMKAGTLTVFPPEYIETGDE